MPLPTPAQLPSSGRSARRGKTLEAADAGQVDAVEDHLELTGRQSDAVGAGRGLGEVVTAGLQALAEQAQAVAAPVQHLEPVGRAIAEDEEVAAERVGVQARADQAKQACRSPGACPRASNNTTA